MFAEILPIPTLYLLPAPLKVVPTPKRMSINKRIAGTNGVMVTGLNGVSVLVERPEDMPRAFRLLDDMLIEPFASPKPIPCAGAEDFSYADLGMADKTPAVEPRWLVEYRGRSAIAVGAALENTIAALTGQPHGVRPEHLHIRELQPDEAGRAGKFAIGQRVRLPLGQCVAKVRAGQLRLGDTPDEDVYWYRVDLMDHLASKWYREEELKED